MLNCETVLLESNQNNATTQTDVCTTLTASMGLGGGYVPMIAYCYDARGNGGGGSIVPTLTGDHQNRITDYTAIVIEENTMDEDNIEYIVRRLTPTECGRLQGFPETDGIPWCDLPEKTDMTDEEFSFWQNARRVVTEMNGKTYKPMKNKDACLKWYNKMIAADSNKYKAIGNSIAVPQWYWLFWKMKPYLSERPTLGSLFDGIGGFPCAFEELYGKGSAVWASEVEPFPIAVTRVRFPE